MVSASKNYLSKNENAARTVSMHVFLAGEMSRLNKGKSEFAKELEITRQSLYDVLNENRKISRLLAEKLAKSIGRTHDFWLKENVIVDSDGNWQENIRLHPAAKNFAVNNPGEGNAPQLLTDELTRNAIEQGFLEISPYFSHRQKSASYDLTIADHLTSISKDEETHIDISQKEYELKPSECVRVKTAEFISLPTDYIARAGATSEYSKLGIFVGYGLQIDPGYKGHLEVSVFNASGRPFYLFKDQVIMSIELFYLPHPPQSGFNESTLLKLKKLLKAQFKFSPGQNGPNFVRWEGAFIDAFGPETEDALVDNALVNIQRKLRGSPGKKLVDCLKNLASLYQMNQEEIVLFLKEITPQLHDYQEHASTERSATQFDDEEDHSLWHVCGELDITLEQIFLLAISK